VDEGMTWVKLLKVILRENFTETLLFIFVVGITLWFTGPIKNLLERLLKIDMKEKKLHFGQGGMTNLDEGKTSESAEAILNYAGNSPLISANVEKIKKDLAEKKQTPENEREILFKYLAVSQLELAFENIYGWIYGTQITLLKELNSRGYGFKSEKNFIIEYVENIIKANPAAFKEITPEQYLEFLKARSLIKEEDSNVMITEVGIEFLSWMVKNGRSENKPF
jgi:hypothetical protein